MSRIKYWLLLIRGAHWIKELKLKIKNQQSEATMTRNEEKSARNNSQSMTRSSERFHEHHNQEKVGESRQKFNQIDKKTKAEIGNTLANRYTHPSRNLKKKNIENQWRKLSLCSDAILRSCYTNEKYFPNLAMYVK